MRRISGLRFPGVRLSSIAALLMLTVARSATGGVSTPTVDLGSGSGFPGDQVAISVTLTANGNMVAATSNDIGFDNTKLSITPADCVINPLIGSGTAADKQLSAALPMANVLRLGVFSTQNVNLIPDGLVV